MKSRPCALQIYMVQEIQVREKNGYTHVEICKRTYRTHVQQGRAKAIYEPNQGLLQRKREYSGTFARMLSPLPLCRWLRHNLSKQEGSLGSRVYTKQN